jgi:cytochrome o ubiquinol oxidase operon protein cyoD
MSDHNTATHKAGAGQKTLPSYLIGLFLSLALTCVAFTLVLQQAMSVENLYITLTVLAVMQLITQVIFFLRMNLSPEGRWTSMSFIFVIFVVLIIVTGSLWIMYNMNYNMVH